MMIILSIILLGMLVMSVFYVWLAYRSYSPKVKRESWRVRLNELRNEIMNYNKTS